MKTQPIIIVGAEQSDTSAVLSQIQDIADVLAVERDPAMAVPLVREHKPKVAVMFLDNDPDLIMSASRQLTRLNGCQAIMVSRDRDPENIVAAMRSGARDFAYLEGVDDDVRRALLQLGDTSKESHSGESQGQVVSVFSCKGGSGATMVATNLAGALADEPNELGEQPKVALLDLDFQMGDVLVFLDLASRFSWMDLIRDQHRLDRELLHRSLTVHESGLHVLAQSDQLEDAEDLDPQAIGNAIQFLRRHYDYVVIDGLRSFNETALTALDGSDKILMTMTQDIPALKNANRCLSLLRRLGYSDEKVKLVLNRFDKKGSLDTDSIEDALGSPVHATLANDFPSVIAGINEGELLVKTAPRARITKDIRALLPMIGYELVYKAKTSLFAGWGRR